MCVVEIARLALATVEGMRIRRFRALERWRPPDEIAKVENITELVYGAGISLSLARRVMAQMSDLTLLERQWNRVRQGGVQAIFFDDPRYPERLKRFGDSPPVLFVKGRVEVLERRGIAVVGTRSPSREGETIAEWIGQVASSVGWNVVSGLAYGVDAAAHRGALSVKEGGVTVAVLGSGLLSVYPREHRSLAEKITEEGALVSERMWGEVRAAWLVQRNRLISGLSDVVLIVEGEENDGSMHTARFAVKQSLPLAVWDWRELSSRSSGTRWLSAHGIPSLNRESFFEWLIEHQTFPIYPPTFFEALEKRTREIQ